MPANEVVIHVDANTAKAQRGLSGLEGTLKKVRGAALLVGGAIAAIGAFSIKAASDVEEMRSKFNVVFGSMSKDVEEWAATTGDAVNRSRFRIMEYLSTLQDTFVPMGLARDQAAEMAKSLTKLAMDVASFSNKMDADVIRDFQSALVGNTETVRKYGIVITEARTKTVAYQTGIAEVGAELTATQKLQARMNILFSDSSDAIGDLERTSGSFANQLKGLQDRALDLRVEIGRQLLPVMVPLLEVITKVATAMGSWAKEHPELTKVIVLTFAALGTFALAVAGLSFVIGPLIGAVTLLKGAFVLLVGVKLTAFVTTMATLTVTAAFLAGKFLLVAAGVMAVVAAVRTLKESFEREGAKGVIEDLNDIITGRGVAESLEERFFGREPSGEAAFGERFGENFMDQIEVMAQKIGGVFGGVTDAISGGVETIQEEIAKLIPSAEDLEDAIEGAGSKAATTAKELEKLVRALEGGPPVADRLRQAITLLTVIQKTELVEALKGGQISTMEFLGAVEDLKKGLGEVGDEIKKSFVAPTFDVGPLAEALGVSLREVDEVVDQLELDLTKMADRALLTATIFGRDLTPALEDTIRQTSLYQSLLQNLNEGIAEAFATGVLSEARAIDILTTALDSNAFSLQRNIQALLDLQSLRQAAGQAAAVTGAGGVGAITAQTLRAFEAGLITEEEVERRFRRQRELREENQARQGGVTVNVDVALDGKQVGEAVGGQVIENSR